MAKVTLTFDLPEELDDFKAALQGRDLQFALWDIDQYLRAKIKHGTHSEEAHKVYAEIRELIHTELQDRDVTLE